MANTSSRECGDVAEVVKQEQLLRLIECPACYEIPMPPILSCTKGHIICHNCQPKLKQCPLCKSSFSLTRNFAVEDIVTSSKFHCNYKKNGCKELILGDQFQNHLKSCPYRNGSKKVKEGSTSEKPPQASQRTKTSNANEQSSSIRRTGGCFQWILSSANDQIPIDAVEGGIENGSRLYIGRGRYFGALVPGKVHSGSRKLLFPWGGHEYVKYEYEVLVAQPNTLHWVSYVNRILPEHAVIGGRNEIGETLYIGRCGHSGTLAVGWILPSQKMIRISYNDCEHTSTVFEVLVKTDIGIALDRQF